MFKNKKIKYFFISILTLASLFLVGNFALADGNIVTDTISSILASIMYALTAIVGKVLMLAMWLLTYVAQYNDFINSPAVANGWVIVRDIGNMFFVLIMLVIAFATILRVEEYNYKKLLPKVIIMAVLINFSKIICGLFIDFTQVIMLSFVNAFKEMANGNLFNMLGLDGLLSMTQNDTLKDSTGVSNSSILGTFVLAFFYVLISLVVVLTMVIMLCYRIIMIWVYVVLSPMAYLLAAFPAGQKYSSQWWDEFSKNLIVGPVLAFFIWLSFASLGNVQSGQQIMNVDTKGADGVDIKTTAPTAGVSKAGSTDHMIKFIISIGMLIGGMTVAQQIGGVVGGIAGKGMAALNSGKAALSSGAKKLGKSLVTGDNWAARKMAANVGGVFTLRPGEIARGFKASMAAKKADDESKIQSRAQANFESGNTLRRMTLGMAASESYFDRYGSWRGMKTIVKDANNDRVRPRLERDKKVADDLQEAVSKKDSSSKRYSDLVVGNEAKRKKIKEELDTYKAIESESMDDNDTEEARKNIAQKEKELMDLNSNEAKAKKEYEDSRIEASTQEDNFRKHFKIKADVNIDDKLLKDKMKEIKENLSDKMIPTAFAESKAERHAVDAAKKNFSHIDNSDQLYSYYKDAMSRGNNIEAKAIMEKMSSDGNGNDLLNNEGFESTAIGLNMFRQKKLKEGFFKNEQESLRWMSDFSSLEEKVNHWDMAKTIGTNSAGQLESLVKLKTGKRADGTERDGSKVEDYDDGEHAKQSYSELMKLEPQKIVQILNRLGYGGQNSEGEFRLSNLGAMLVKTLGSNGTFRDQGGRMQANAAMFLTQPKVLEAMRKMGIDTSHTSPDGGKTKGNLQEMFTRAGKSKDSGGSIKNTDVYNFVINTLNE